MKGRSLFLALGIVLSLASKYLQFRYSSIWGNLLILPAATFFILAILLFIPQYVTVLRHARTRKKAILLATLCCLAVFFFQLFTMIAFGKGKYWRFIFIIPVLIFTGWSLIIANQLKKEKY